jgi:nucleotide-binding universal stress UspA family protein
MTRSIVLAVRVGEASAAPATTAAWLARELGARITVVHVASQLEAARVGAAEAGIDPADERELAVNRLRTEIDAFVAEHLAGFQTEVRLLDGDVAEQVARAAAVPPADLIVVGTRGRSGLAKLVLGDTTQSILQRAPCPVVVVPLAESV